jgi:hypothetical protein
VNLPAYKAGDSGSFRSFFHCPEMGFLRNIADNNQKILILIKKVLAFFATLPNNPASSDDPRSRDEAFRQFS